MIGGNDIVFNKQTEPADRIVIVQAFRKAWPDLVVQDGAAEGSVPFDDALGIVASADEFFVYRDEASFKSWSEHGALPQNDDQMVHVMVAPDEITLVVAGAASETHRMAHDAIAALSSPARANIGKLLPSVNPTVADEPHWKDRVVTKGSRLPPREEQAA
jgi:hypothetical protein